MTNEPDQATLPSERRFGIFIGGALLLVGLWLLWRKGSPWGWLPIAAAGALLLLAWLAPNLLKGPNRLWYGLGQLLGRIVSPVVLGLMFLILITPLALIMRLAGRDALRIRKRAVDSYWIRREPAGPQPESFRNQY